MVDFNNESTIGTPATDVEKISILQRRYDLLEAYEHYRKGRMQGVNINLSVVRARLTSLFLEVQATLKRRFKKDEYEEIKSLVFADNLEEEDFKKALFIINEELDNLRLTRVDNQKVYNSFKVEEENKIKGY